MRSLFDLERLVEIYVEMDILAWFSFFSVILFLVGAATVWVVTQLARLLSRFLWERRIRRHNMARKLNYPLRRQ